MLVHFLDLRLAVIDSCNQLTHADQEATAGAWADILESEAARLIDSAGPPLQETPSHCSVFRMRQLQREAQARGEATAHLALIVADQVVAALIRGHLRSESVA